MTKKSHSSIPPTWHHAGGKFVELGPEAVTDTELLAILISSGVKGRSAEEIAEEIMGRFRSFKGMAHQPLKNIQPIKGLGETKVIRIAAAFEMAKRMVEEVLKDYEPASDC